MSKNFCFYCERSFSRISVGEFTDEGLVVKSKDHIIPRSRGGKDVPLNIVYACEECNQKKDDLFLEQFLFRLDLEINEFLPTSRSKVVVKLKLIRKNVLRLMEIIKPHLADIRWDNCQIQRSNVSAPDDWPEIEVSQTFDWSLSLEEIGRRYSPPNSKLKTIKKIYKELAWPEPEEIKSQRPKIEPGTALAKLKGKYGYIYEMMIDINPDLPRWIMENVGYEKLMK